MAVDPRAEFCCDCSMPHRPDQRHRRIRRRLRALRRSIARLLRP